MEGTAIAEKSESQMGRFFLIGHCIPGKVSLNAQLPARFLGFFCFFFYSSEISELIPFGSVSTEGIAFHQVAGCLFPPLHAPMQRFSKDSSQSIDVIPGSREGRSVVVLSIGVPSRKSSQ